MLLESRGQQAGRKVFRALERVAPTERRTSGLVCIVFQMKLAMRFMLRQDVIACYVHVGSHMDV
jgi:hypothetical protein